MKRDRIREIADAVLYEGYILYPYRASAIKNQQRWTFGCVFPAEFGVGHGDSCRLVTQALIEGDAQAKLDVRVRFLHIMTRAPRAFARPLREPAEGDEAQAEATPRLVVEGREYLHWEEAIEREIVLSGLELGQLAASAARKTFRIESERKVEWIRGPDGAAHGAVVRTTLPVEGVVTVRAAPVGSASRLTVAVENVTPLDEAELRERGKAQLRAFASTHVVMETQGGAFVSLFDPPDAFREAAEACENTGAWPVLVGKKGDRDTILASPIILYDYPSVAAQSPGDLYDGAEIDEILTLRILAMTEEEKREMSSVDARARALLERTHALTAAEFSRLHGIMRGANEAPEPECNRASAAGPTLGSLVGRGQETQVALKVGMPVILHPKPGGDIMDIALNDKLAFVEAIERDFEDRVHVAVTLADDPGRDLAPPVFPATGFISRWMKLSRRGGATDRACRHEQDSRGRDRQYLPWRRRLWRRGGAPPCRKTASRRGRSRGFRHSRGRPDLCPARQL